jgi:hypothetical protein
LLLYEKQKNEKEQEMMDDASPSGTVNSHGSAGMSEKKTAKIKNEGSIESEDAAEFVDA